jgi:hypothetical protein
MMCAPRVTAMFFAVFLASLLPGASLAELDQRLRSEFVVSQQSKTELAITQMGTILAVRNPGLIGVGVTAPGTYANNVKDTKITHSFASRLLLNNQPIRGLVLGERLVFFKLDVKDSAIVFFTVTCGDCNTGALSPDSMMAEVAFHFAKGYLASADYAEVRRTIGRIIDIGPPSPPQTITAATPAPPAAPQPATVYLNEKNTAESIRLNADGTFSGNQRGVALSGTYAVDGAKITFAIAGSNRPSVGRIDGDRIIDDEGINWVAQAETPTGQPAQAAQSASPEAAPVKITIGQPIKEVLAVLGKPEKLIDLGDKKILTFKDLKVTFLNGKVSDVQ